VHLLAQTSRHTGREDILREELDGAVETDAEAMPEHDAVFWAERHERIAECADCGSARYLRHVSAISSPAADPASRAS
jgi:hypothetical protein